MGLYQSHREGLAGAVRAILGASADTSEVLQESFYRAWRALQRGATPEHPVGWIFMITMNLSKDLRRSQDRGPHMVNDAVAASVPAGSQTPAQQAEKAESVVAARQAIQELKPAEKEIFLLRVSAGMTFEAIALQLGIPVGTAKTRMRTALQRLRLALAAHAPSISESSLQTHRE